MFAKTVIDSDIFLGMPLKAQALYFHLSMRADDDGFVNNPKKIQRMIGSNEGDLKLLIANKFIIPFESGVVVIKHWRINNYLRSDRYKETAYLEEKSRLEIEKNGAYALVESGMYANGIPNDNQAGYQRDTQNSIGKISINEDTPPLPPKGKAADKTQYAEFVTMTEREYNSLCERVGERGAKRCIEILDNYKGANGKRYASDYRAILSWVITKYNEEPQPEPEEPIEFTYPTPEENVLTDIEDSDTLADLLKKINAEEVRP